MAIQWNRKDKVGGDGYLRGTCLTTDTKPTVSGPAILIDEDGAEFKWAGTQWIQTGSAGAANVITGTGGGASSVTTLENFLVAGGASQTGTAVSFPSGRATFQSVANGTSGAYTATVDIYGSNDNTNFELLGTISLSGTATTADSDGFATDAPWAYVRADVSSFTGTGATCDVYMAI